MEPYTQSDIKDLYTKYLFEKNQSLQNKIKNLEAELQELKKKLGI